MYEIYHVTNNSDKFYYPYNRPAISIIFQSIPHLLRIKTILWGIDIRLHTHGIGSRLGKKISSSSEKLYTGVLTSGKKSIDTQQKSENSQQSNMLLEFMCRWGSEVLAADLLSFFVITTLVHQVKNRVWVFSSTGLKWKEIWVNHVFWAISWDNSLKEGDLLFQ